MADDLSRDLGHHIPLFEMLQTLRQELAASATVTQCEPLRFQVEELELELRVQVSDERSKGGKFGFWVVEAGGDDQRTRQDVHVFKLKLKPEQELLVNDTVSGRPQQPGR